MRLILLTLILFLSCFLVFAYANTGNKQTPFRNLIDQPEDTQKRASIGYMLHRAWIQMTRQKFDENKIAQIPLDLEALAQQDFAIAWLGHDTMLIRAGNQWILTDPVFSQHATAVPPFGPKRLVQLPIDLKNLPHIDVVLISHDHFDHLDLASVKLLAKQSSGSPQFIAGIGLKNWFKANVPDANVLEMQCWDETKIANVDFQFVPAQHSSGRKFTNKNNTLWGGWVIEYTGRKLYFAGDTAYEAELFKEIKLNVGHINIAALPVGAYMPRDYMRFELMDPSEAVQAHIDLQADSSIAIHWGTFQLGDETSDQIRADFSLNLESKKVDNFKLLAIGQVVNF